jgi:hypothetical protein
MHFPFPNGGKGEMNMDNSGYNAEKAIKARKGGQIFIVDKLPNLTKKAAPSALG